MAKRNAIKLDDTTCRQMTGLVLDYLTGRLSATVKREFERHLAICPDCMNFLNTYKKTVSVSKALEPCDIPAKVRDRILIFLRKRMRRIGVLLIFVISRLVV